MNAKEKQEYLNEIWKYKGGAQMNKLSVKGINAGPPHGATSSRGSSVHMNNNPLRGYTYNPDSPQYRDYMRERLNSASRTRNNASTAQMEADRRFDTFTNMGAHPSPELARRMDVSANDARTRYEDANRGYDNTVDAYLGAASRSSSPGSWGVALRSPNIPSPKAEANQRRPVKALPRYGAPQRTPWTRKAADRIYEKDKRRNQREFDSNTQSFDSIMSRIGIDTPERRKESMRNKLVPTGHSKNAILNMAKGPDLRGNALKSAPVRASMKAGQVNKLAYGSNKKPSAPVSLTQAISNRMDLVGKTLGPYDAMTRGERLANYTDLYNDISNRLFDGSPKYNPIARVISSRYPDMFSSPHVDVSPGPKPLYRMRDSAKPEPFVDTPRPISLVGRMVNKINSR